MELILQIRWQEAIVSNNLKQMTHRLPMVVFFNIVNIRALNAMNIWLKFQIVLQQFKNRARRSYSPYNIG